MSIRKRELRVLAKMNGKKRILHIIQSLDNGGCENMLLRTLPLLGEFEHKIITLKKSGELAPEFISAGIPVDTVRCGNFFSITGIMRLRRMIREENSDIIITYLFHADVIGRFFIPRKINIPVIPFLRTTYNHPKYLVARIFEWLTKIFVRQYFANSDAVKDYYVKHFGVSAEKINVVPNGIDVSIINSIEPDIVLRKSLNISHDAFVLICVANFHSNKGHSYLLKAFEQVYLKYPKTVLLLVGDGDERKNLEQQILGYASRKAIRFLGKRNDVLKLLKLSHVFVLPTLFEGMSNAIMEAMAMGVPVITTSIPENTTWLLHGETAFLVRPKSSKVLADAITQMVDNKQISLLMADNAKSLVERKFNLNMIVEQWRVNLLSQ
jgi:glycosyltransferase involved in cell wall biosynthesis